MRNTSHFPWINLTYLIITGGERCYNFDNFITSILWLDSKCPFHFLIDVLMTNSITSMADAVYSWWVYPDSVHFCESQNKLIVCEQLHLFTRWFHQLSLINREWVTLWLIHSVPFSYISFPQWQRVGDLQFSCKVIGTSILWPTGCVCQHFYILWRNLISPHNMAIGGEQHPYFLESISYNAQQEVS